MLSETKREKKKIEAKSSLGYVCMLSEKKNMNNMVFMKCKTHPNEKKECGNDVMWWEYNIYAVANENTKYQGIERRMRYVVENGKNWSQTTTTTTIITPKWIAQAEIFCSMNSNNTNNQNYTAQTPKQSYAKQHFSMFQHRAGFKWYWWCKLRWRNS